jgi:hypothetical protein
VLLELNISLPISTGSVEEFSNNFLVFQDKVLWWLFCIGEQEVIGEAGTPSACQKS